ncbi:MAG: type III-B CRISPR-associated protein Cas10/Cmr2 [Alicyclobacillus sp.]|nr:type III-B CRISPR-associated protein Cas10/Cmr2 [Alicyclobacillus sp.]
MASYLYGLSIGPVQDFIKAARRTRDLWFGSYMLSELTRQAGRVLIQQGMNCVYPERELLSEEESAPVPNRLVGRFEVDDEQQLRQYTTEAKHALQQELRAMGRRIVKLAGSIVDEHAFYRQLDDFLEVYAAWVPYRPDDYSASRQRLEALLAGRKLLRNFQPYSGRPLPKSVLDGGRETVLRTTDAQPRLGIRQRESLDAVGLIKRLGGGRRAYPSVVRVAVQPWMERISKEEGVRPALEYLKQVLHAFCERGIPVTSHTSPEVYPQYADFPYDGRALLEGFLLSQEFQSIAEQEQSVLAGALSQLHESLQKKGIRPFPVPYVALLLADGDRMGAALNRLHSVDQHMEFSRRLTSFSAHVGHLVESFRGVVVYAGGDDVFALLPIHTCIAAARALKNAFEQQVASYFNTVDPPTLSVGIAIGHCLENLADLREWAESAEQTAKQPDRNALYVQVVTRSGGTPIGFRGRWTDAPDERLLKWIQWTQQSRIPSTLGYEIAELAQEYHFVDGLTKEWMLGELPRILRRKRAGAAAIEPLDTEVVEELSRHVDDKRPLASIIELSNLLKVARWFAFACDFDGGERGEIGVE